MHQLMNWEFMNSELLISTDASLFELKAQIRAKHGALFDLRVMLMLQELLAPLSAFRACRVTCFAAEQYSSC